MGRPERPIDPGDGPVAKFASELRKLRDEVGRPSYRELARRVSFSVTVLSEAAGGRSFPTLAVVRGYVRACGGDVTEWERRWLRAADELREEPNGATRRPAPYLGLASYGEEHAGLFFGREALTGDLLRRLAAGRFLAVFGASGSGKSSLLRAGLLAAVHRGKPESAADWTTVLFTPGEEPVAALAGQMAALAGGPDDPVRDELLAEPEALHRAAVQALDGKPAGADLLLVVDQFEELFTVCTDGAQRDCFVRALLAAVTADDACTRVVLGVRADFYAQCARWPELVTALRDSQLLVGPLSQDELREVIVKPAEHAGMAVEGALVATALAEVGTEPGALALVSHALLETWRHSPPGRMTLAAYTDAGGVPNAIASTAERVYAECDDGQRALLRGLVLRLVAIGDGASDTRRRVPPDELSAAGTGAAALVEKLARARLVTVDDDSVQLAHEALIRHWPRLAEWLADSRDGLRVQRRLADAAREWARLGRDPAALYRGTPLAVARAWDAREGGPGGLTAVEREFLDASSAAQAADQVAAVRAARRLRRLVAALAVLLAAALTAAGIAGWQRADALSAEQAALSGQLAGQSSVFSTVNPSAAILAALAAWYTEPTTETRSALLSTAGCCTSTQTSLYGDSGNVNAVALSPGGKLLAAGGADRTVHLWDTASGRQQAVLSGPREQFYALAFSPNGGILAAGAADGKIWLWNPSRHNVLRVLSGDTGTIGGLAFNSNGTLLASASADGQIRLWNPATGSAEKLTTSGKRMQAVAFSPHGDTLAAAGDDGTVTLWNVADPAHPRVAGRLTGAKTAVEDLAYGPGGTMIAAEESNGDVVLWNLPGRGIPRTLTDASSRALGLTFSQDGNFLLVAGSKIQLRLYDTATGQQVATDSYLFLGNVRALAYDPDSDSLALGGPAGSVQFWQQPVVPFTGSAGPVAGLAVVSAKAIASAGTSDKTLRLWNSGGGLVAAKRLLTQPDALAVSPDGRLVATVENGGAVNVFNLPDLAPVQSFHVPMPTYDVAFSPDGRLLAASGGKSVTLWDAVSGKLRQILYSNWGNTDTIAFGPGGGTITAGTGSGTAVTWSIRTGRTVADASDDEPGPVNAIAFSPDGRLLATAGNEGTITLRDPATLHPLGTLQNAAASIQSLAFSPDGRVLAAGSTNGTITLWDVASRTLTATLAASQDTVRGLAFAPHGTTLFSGGNGRIIAWNLDPDAVISKDCQILSGDPGLVQAETLVPGFSSARLCPSG